MRKISSKSLKCKYLSDLIWNSDTSLRRGRRENRLLIWKPTLSLSIFSVLCSHSQTQWCFLLLHLREALFKLGVDLTFTFKEIYLWVFDCWSPVISLSTLKGICIPILQISPSACHVARRPVRPWPVCGGKRGPRHASTHQGVARQTWQPDDTCFCVSYHFTNHLHFI